MIWEHLIQGTAPDDMANDQVDFQLYRNFFLPNHDAIIGIIESNVHLAQPDRELKHSNRFVRHVTIYKAISRSRLVRLTQLLSESPGQTGSFQQSSNGCGCCNGNTITSSGLQSLANASGFCGCSQLGPRDAAPSLTPHSAWNTTSNSSRLTVVKMMS